MADVNTCTFNNWVTVILINKHTKEYITFYTCTGYRIVPNHSYTYNKDELGHYNIEIFFPNGRHESFPLVDYDLFIHEDLSSRIFSYPN